MNPVLRIVIVTSVINHYIVLDCAYFKHIRVAVAVQLFVERGLVNLSIKTRQQAILMNQAVTQNSDISNGLHH